MDLARHLGWDINDPSIRSFLSAVEIRDQELENWLSKTLSSAAMPVFAFEGYVIASTSAAWTPILEGIAFTHYRVLYGNKGSGTSTVEIQKNGTAMVTASLTTDDSGDVEFTDTLDAGDLLTVEAVTVQDDDYDLTVMFRAEPAP